MSVSVDYDKTARKLVEYARTRDVRLRNELVEQNLYIAQIIAHRFAGHGIAYEDLLQVASLALVKAVERFDPERGVRLSTFVTPTIVGEIKNHFRDQFLPVRLPRQLSERLQRINQQRDILAVRLGRTPTPYDIATALSLDVEDVLEAMSAGEQTSLVSLDQTISEDGKSDVADMLGKDDEGFERVEWSSDLRQAMEDLDEKEKWVLEQRYVHRRSQRELAREMNVSQMYLSRLERKLLTRLRARLA